MLIFVMLNKYNVFISEGEILEGSTTGKATFAFSRNGFYIRFVNSDLKVYAKKFANQLQIKNLQIKKIVKEELKKGSLLAKYGMLSVATNRQNVDTGQRISASMALDRLSRDQIKLKELTICLIEYDTGSASIILDEKVNNVSKKIPKEMIDLAFNNPKKFFETSISEVWASNQYHAGILMFFIFFPLWVLIVIIKIFEKKKWQKLIGTEEYNKILQNL